MIFYKVELDDRKRRILAKLAKKRSHSMQDPTSLSEVNYKTKGKTRDVDFTKIDENSSIVCLRDFGVSREQAWRICREMYGVIGIMGEYTGFSRLSYDGFYIPDENLSMARRAIRTSGDFEKELFEEGVDLPVLEAIFRRSERLRRRFSQSYNPRFHITEILRLAHLDELDRKRVRRALDKRLTGLLCRTNQIRSKNLTPYQNMPEEVAQNRAKVDAEYEKKNPDDILFGPTDEEYGDNWVQPGKDVRVYVPRWFVPTARIPEIKRVLK